jgi:2'-5' RNA ligase
VFWAGVDGESGPLADIHAALGRELSALEFELDSRPFSPHITIGYARKRADRSALSRAASDLAAEADKRLGSDGVPFPVEAVSLVESVLGRGGPQYTDLERVALAGG